MQPLLSKKIGHSEAKENLVEGLPVQERGIPLQIQSTTGKNEQIKSILRHARLDLEISMYWMLSKYQQSKSKKIPLTA